MENDTHLRDTFVSISIHPALFPSIQSSYTYRRLVADIRSRIQTLKVGRGAATGVRGHQTLSRYVCPTSSQVSRLIALLIIVTYCPRQVSGTRSNHLAYTSHLAVVRPGES